MRSIRREVTISLIVAMALLFTIFGLSLYGYVRYVLVNRFDLDLLNEAVSLSAFTMQEPAGHLEFELNPEATPQFQISEAPKYFQVWYASGELLARSPSLKGADLRPLSRESTPAFVDLRLPDGRSGRAVEFRFTPLLELVDGVKSSVIPPPPPPMIVVVAREREALDGTLLTIGGFFAVGSLVIVVGGAILVSFIVARTTRPLRRLVGDVEAMQPDILDRRLPLEGLPMELCPIVEKLNGLLERVDTVLRRERRFTADAAHELRTPVAELRTLTEVALNWSIDNPTISQAFGDAKDIAIHMESLIAALLDLSRHEAGTMQAHRELVDLCPLVREVHRSIQSRSKDGNPAIDLILPESSIVETDPDLARACVHNLMDNAVKYSPPGAHVTCRLTVSPQSVMLRITNACRELTAEDLRHIGEPFWRKDTARSGSEHSGLGIALVKAYAKALSAEFVLELDGDKEFVTQLRFPANGNPSHIG